MWKIKFYYQDENLIEKQTITLTAKTVEISNYLITIYDIVNELKPTSSIFLPIDETYAYFSNFKSITVQMGSLIFLGELKEEEKGKGGLKLLSDEK